VLLPPPRPSASRDSPRQAYVWTDRPLLPTVASLIANAAQGSQSFVARRVQLGEESPPSPHPAFVSNGGNGVEALARRLLDGMPLTQIGVALEPLSPLSPACARNLRDAALSHLRSRLLDGSALDSGGLAWLDGILAAIDAKVPTASTASAASGRPQTAATESRAPLMSFGVSAEVESAAATSGSKTASAGVSTQQSHQASLAATASPTPPPPPAEDEASAVAGPAAAGGSGVQDSTDSSSSDGEGSNSSSNERRKRKRKKEKRERKGRKREKKEKKEKKRKTAE